MHPFRLALIRCMLYPIHNDMPCEAAIFFVNDESEKAGLDVTKIERGAGIRYEVAYSHRTT